MRILTFIAVLLTAVLARAQTDSPMPAFINGHNLSITSDVLGAGHCAIGLEIVACGVTDRFTLGTSTWMLADYNMASVAGRVLVDEDSVGNRWAIQTIFFQTFNARDWSTEGQGLSSAYRMQAYWLQVVRTYNLAPHYRLHLNLDANYYSNERMPFSLRRPYMNKTPYQFNLTSLHEMALFDGWFILGEGGFLDLARDPLHLHGGVSLGWAGRHFSGHFGFTATGSTAAFFAPVRRYDYQQALRDYTPDGYDHPMDPTLVEYDFSLHPEFSAQFLF